MCLVLKALVLVSNYLTALGPLYPQQASMGAPHGNACVTSLVAFVASSSPFPILIPVSYVLIVERAWFCKNNYSAALASKVKATLRHSFSLPFDYQNCSEEQEGRDMFVSEAKFEHVCLIQPNYRTVVCDFP
jgi:hypothetical protein